jgi:hypothetical protein
MNIMQMMQGLGLLLLNSEAKFIRWIFLVKVELF